jgi:hypothetical protein
LRRLKLAHPVQLQLVPPTAPTPKAVWAGLPEPTKDRVLVLLARLVARGLHTAGDAKETS